VIDGILDRDKSRPKDNAKWLHSQLLAGPRQFQTRAQLQVINALPMPFSASAVLAWIMSGNARQQFFVLLPTSN